MTSERGLVRAAEVALAALTLAVVAGMHRLFADGSWAGPLLANAAVAHVVAMVLRRRGLSLGVSALVMTVAAALVVTWASYWSTTTLGIPTGDTWTALRADLDTAWELYQDVDAPAPVATGFVVASSLALWAIAYVADWAAFRLWVPFEATLPAGTLFLFTALLGADAGRVWSVAIYAAALLLFLLLHRLARQEGSSHWVAERKATGHRSLLTAGSALALVAVVAGSVIGPELPGADSAGVVDPRDLNGDDEPRVTVSPLVDIRSRLVEQSNVQVFTVQSGERAYWRLTSLERFDGRIWSSSGSYGKADGDLPESVDTDVDRATFDQEYVIEALAAIWLPSAYEARSLRTDDLEVRYDEDSATLIVDSSVPTSDGLGYVVTSSSPRLTPEDLGGTAAEIPDEIRSRFGGLPEGFSQRVRDLAAELTAGADTPYEQARALQDHLRTFTYDLEVSAGHSGDALERFLFDTQRGYCEQFAGSFAAMARAIGLPARVAVGFTPGEVDPNTPGLFHVRGEHAHAWPEVYFAGAGWVAFEPTPGRGMPAAEPYTGVPEQQALAGQPRESEVVTVPTTAPQGGGSDGGAAPTTIAQPEEEVQTPEEDDPPSALERWLLDPLRTALPYAIGLVLLYALGVPAALMAHRTRRRQRAEAPDQRIALAWVEAVEDASLVGFHDRASDTHAERAARLAGVLEAATGPAIVLARASETADYTLGGAGAAEVDAAVAAAAQIGAAARAVAPLPVRVRRWLDPRPPLRAWRRSRTGQQRRITMRVDTGEHGNEPELVGVGAGAQVEVDEG
jgi:transglutaminase-like putative cysteine protease